MAMQRALEASELSRFSRQIVLPEIGVQGQQKLKNARVLCVGAGGLGSPLALYLAAAGVGTIGLVDADTVDGSNLQRQILYSTSDIGKHKVSVAAERLTSLNPGLQVIQYNAMLDHENAIQYMFKI
jgi:molybdopterin/thiamine biosynthesis adenylyltransferase